MDALSANKQENLGRQLARTDVDGRQTYDALAATDSDAADALAAIEDPVTQRQFVNAYQRGEVEIEPGRNDDYDMSIKQGGQPESVEVETRTRQT